MERGRKSRMDRSLPLNDDTDYGLCFACGSRNSSGLRLRFKHDQDRIVTEYVPTPNHQGFPGYLHGGVISTLLDEVMSRVSLLDNRWTMTARMDVRYRKPILMHQHVKAYAKLRNEHRGVFEVTGWVELPDGSTAAEAKGTFVPVKAEALARMNRGYPILAREWMSG